MVKKIWLNTNSLHRSLVFVISEFDIMGYCKSAVMTAVRMLLRDGLNNRDNTHINISSQPSVYVTNWTAYFGFECHTHLAFEPREQTPDGSLYSYISFQVEAISQQRCIYPLIHPLSTPTYYSFRDSLEPITSHVWVKGRGSAWTSQSSAALFLSITSKISTSYFYEAHI